MNNKKLWNAIYLILLVMAAYTIGYREGQKSSAMVIVPSNRVDIHDSAAKGVLDEPWQGRCDAEYTQCHVGDTDYSELICESLYGH